MAIDMDVQTQERLMRMRERLMRMQERLMRIQMRMRMQERLMRMQMRMREGLMRERRMWERQTSWLTKPLRMTRIYQWNSRLQWESYLGNVENVKRCIRNGADVNAPVTTGSSMLASINPSYIGKPPLSIAMSNKHSKVEWVLRKHGATTWEVIEVLDGLNQVQQALAGGSPTRSRLINFPGPHQSWISKLAAFRSVAAVVAERNYAGGRLLQSMVDDHEQRVGFVSQNTSSDVHIIDVVKLLTVETVDELAAQDHADRDDQIGFSDIEASLNGTNEGFKELLQALKERAVYLRDGVSNRNVLHLVAEHGDLENFITLIEVLGSNMLINLVNAQDKDGRTPLILVVLAGKKNMVAHLCRKERRIADEILPNIEDNLRKTALDHAKEMNESSMVMELMKRADVQYYQEEQYRDMQLWAESGNKIGTASGVIAALMFASNQLYVAPMNSKVAIWITVCFGSALGGVFASIMNIVAAPTPKQHNVKATIFYLRRMFEISSIMVSISSSSFVGALLAAAMASSDRHTTSTTTNTPATSMIKAPITLSLYILLIGLTILAGSLSRIAAIRRFGKHFF